MARTSNQNTASKKLAMNGETWKTSDNFKPPVQDLLVTQIGNCSEKFADALGQHMNTLGNQISKIVIDAMKTSNNLKIDKEEGTKKLSHSFVAKASKKDNNHSRRNRQKLRNNFCRDKYQIQKSER